MYGDWSFPETSERIGQRRRGGEGWGVANPFHGGGGGGGYFFGGGGGGPGRGGGGGGVRIFS